MDFPQIFGENPHVARADNRYPEDMLRVLIIDDDEQSTELLRVRLEDLDCQAHIVQTADAGIEAAVQTRPDLILLDLRLVTNRYVTECEGLRALTALRAQPATADIPIFIHSVYVNDEHEMREEAPAADGLLRKPITREQLQDIIVGVRRASLRRDNRS